MPDQSMTGLSYECPDCASEAQLVQVTPGVYVLEVRHDDTCPQLQQAAHE